jgi:Flp pilus assembly pilin Flp
VGRPSLSRVGSFGRNRDNQEPRRIASFLDRATTRKESERVLEVIRTRLGDQDGQGLVDYTLTVSLIAVVCILALTATGQSLSAILDSIAGQV